MKPRQRTIDDVAAMSPAELQSVAQGIELQRRQLEANAALLVQQVDDVAAYRTDGHRNVAAWGRGTNNWSASEASKMAKLARAMRIMPEFARSALAGELGIGQMHDIAAIAANPRVRDHLAGADELLTRAGRDLEYPDFATLLRHWETLADTDGARARHDRAVRDRHANVSFVGERAFLEAACPAYDGTLIAKVLDHYADQEWQNEWDILKAIHGDQMHPGLMERTPQQRRFDALHRICANAAAGSDDTGPAVTVDLVIDLATYEHELETMLGGNPEPVPPEHAAHRRCEDGQGHVVDPRDVVAASLVAQVRRKVVGADGVVLDMGRRQRLFTGPLREAVLGSTPHCTHKGCLVRGHRCEADHLIPFARGGLTNARNGAPGCNTHNPWKNNGAITVRDAKGLFHTYRPDGTEIGWPTILVTLEHADLARYALQLAYSA